MAGGRLRTSPDYMKHVSPPSKPSLKFTAAGSILAFASTCATAQIATPGGALGDTAVIIEATGGEQLTRATAAGALGPLLTHDFDTVVNGPIDGSYELTGAGAIGLSAGRHLVVYDTRFDAGAGANRAEIQTRINLDGNALVAGRSQGYIRRAGGADETVLPGGAIITVAADNDVLTLESQRSDTNTNASLLPTRIANGTAVQLLKLDDAWDFLSLERSANQAGINNATF